MAKVPLNLCKTSFLHRILVMRSSVVVIGSQYQVLITKSKWKVKKLIGFLKSESFFLSSNSTKAWWTITRYFQTQSLPWPKFNWILCFFSVETRSAIECKSKLSESKNKSKKRGCCFVNIPTYCLLDPFGPPISEETSDRLMELYERSPGVKLRIEGRMRYIAFVSECCRVRRNAHRLRFELH